jgi:hypothetical protein
MTKSVEKTCTFGGERGFTVLVMARPGFTVLGAVLTPALIWGSCGTVMTTMIGLSLSTMELA